MSHQDFDALIDEHGADFDAAAEALEGTLAQHARGEVSIEVAETTIIEVGADLDGRSAAWSQNAVPAAYLDGSEEAYLDLRYRVKPDEILRRGDFAVMSALLRDGLLDDLAGATDQITRDAKQSLRRMARRSLETITVEGADLDDVALDMEQEMAQRGVKFTDRIGRRWDPGAYSRMLMRTYMAEALNTGELITAAHLGARYVRVSDGHGNDTDEPCARANGQVWAVAYALRHLIEHPNCRRAFGVLSPAYRGRVDHEAPATALAGRT